MISDDISLCSSLIGKPWVSGGRGPDEFDCWGLLAFVYAISLGIKLPDYPNLNAKDLHATTKLSASLVEKGNWLQIEKPEHLCAVGMSRNRLVHHVGLWLVDGDSEGIFHTASGQGAMFQTVTTVRQAGMQNITFYKFKK